MTQDKMRKTIAACVSAATVLFVLLLGYLIYQWATMAVLDKREKQLQAEIDSINQIISAGEEEALWYEEGPGKMWGALENGWQPSSDAETGD